MMKNKDSDDDDIDDDGIKMMETYSSFQKGWPVKIPPHERASTKMKDQYHSLQ